MNTICRQCCTTNPTAARFCMGCGTGLAHPSAPTGLRFVTVAFCDIAGSTQLALRFDPQVWHSILETYFAEVGGALVAAGGRLEKFIGDAVVGVFGADNPGEDDARHAVLGALAAVEQLAARTDETMGRHGTRLTIRFGIASGRVMMADRDSSFAIGSVMNRAARLQGAAPASGTVVDVRTWLLVREQLACTPVPPVPAKGFDKPLQAWVATRDTMATPAEPPFVNQIDLLAQLTDAVQAAADTPGATTIGLLGEMGSGKTRILRRLIRRARERRMHTIFIACQDDNDGLWRLQQIDRELGGSRGGTGAGSASTSELQWRIRSRFAELSTERPLLVVVDDYHRCPATLHGLLDLPADLPGPVVVVLAGRQAPTGPQVNFEVPPLSEEDSQELLATLYDEIELHSTTALAPLIRRSRGNPLFLEQLAAMAGEVTEDGIVEEVPPSAEAALGARLARLPAEARQLLACIGAWAGDLRPGDLDAVCDLDEATIATNLGELERLGLAANRTATEVAYAHLGLGERARVHTAIARRLQEYASTEPALLELAVSHATTAYRQWRELDPGSAHDDAAAQLTAHCLIAAARQAIARSEVRPAAVLAARARELGIPDGDLTLEIAALESYALGAGGRVSEALQRIAEVDGHDGNPSARVHLAVNRMALGVGDVSQARELARLADDPCATARLHTWEGLAAARSGDYIRAEALLRSAHAGMRAFGVGLGVAEIYGNLSLFLGYGDTAVREATAHCLALRDEVADAPILHAAVSCSAAVLLQRGGDHAAAVEMLAQARSVFNGVGHVLGEAGSYEFSGVVAELAGDLTAAADAVQRAGQVYTAAGATQPAGRCALRAYVLRPEAVPPDISTVDAVDSWDVRVLRHQVSALATADSSAAVVQLDRALEEIAAIRGGGATLIPLSGCLRIAQRLGAGDRTESIRTAIERANRQ